MDDDPRLALLLALADDELILGHRHSEWTGWAPHIEEDLAFSSIAQDEMAHARLLYGLAKEATGRDEDSLALGRRPEEYRNAVLCERPNRDWGYSLARQFLYDTADAVRLEAVAASSWGELAELTGVIRLEEKYHLDHARALFEPIPGEEGLVADGALPRASEDLLADWLGRLGEDLEAVSLDYVLEHHGPIGGEMVPTSTGEIEAGADALAVPGIVRRDGRWAHEGAFAGAGGRRGRHSEDFQPLWDEMTKLYREHPGATW